MNSLAQNSLAISAGNGCQLPLAVITAMMIAVGSVVR